MIKQNLFKTILLSSALVFFFSCDADKDVVTNSSNVEQSYSLKSGTVISQDLEARLNLYAEKHVGLNNEIRMILESETGVDFKNLALLNQIEASEDETKLKDALSQAGVVKYEELGDLIISLGQNGYDFYTDNREFDSLDQATQNSLLEGAIDNAIIGNPIIWTPEDPGESPTARTCYQQYIVDRDRCNRNCVRDTFIATFAWGAGPLAGGVAYFGVAWITQDCLDDAREDYDDCRS